MSPNSLLLGFKNREEAIGQKVYETLKPRPWSPAETKKGAKKRPDHLANPRRSKGKKKPQYLTRYRHLSGKEELDFRGALYLYANNPKARVRFARIFLEAVKSHLKSPTNEDLLKCPVYLVTFALKRFACSMEDAKTYDLRPLQAWVRQKMEGFSYLGMVDVAFYSNVNVQTGVYPLPEKEEAKKVKPSERDRGQMASWHVHLLVWGVPRARLKTLVDEVNVMLANGSPKNPSLVDGLRAADYRQVKSERFEGKVLYILKSPREYRVWPEKEEVIDPETGEIAQPLTGRFIQRSRVLRCGDGVRMFQVMQDRYLDGMMLGGGAGRDLLWSIRKEALKPLRCRERRAALSN